MVATGWHATRPVGAAEQSNEVTGRTHCEYSTGQLESLNNELYPLFQSFRRHQLRVAEPCALPRPRWRARHHRSTRARAAVATLLRFLPMLWPKGEAELKARVIAAVLLVLAGKAAVLLMPFAYKAVIDRMSVGRRARSAVVAGLVLAYCAARFAGVLSDNLRNALFEKVGQHAARRLAGDGVPPRPRSVAALPPRAAHRRADQDRRARHQEHRHDALFPAVQHRPDGDRAGRDLHHLLRQVRPRAGRRDPGDGRRSTSPSPAR